MVYSMGVTGAGCVYNGKLVKSGETYNVPSATSGSGLLQGVVYKCTLSNGVYKAELNGECGGLPQPTYCV